MSASVSIPPEQLGHLLGEFGWNQGRAKFLLGVWLFLFLLSLPLSLVLIGLPGLIASAYFVVRSFKRLRQTKPILLVYQHGIVDQRKGTAAITYYQDVKNLFLGVVVINGVLNYLVTLEPQQGQKVKIDEHVANVDRVRTLIEEQFVGLHLPAAIAAYQEGTAIEFGSLKVTQAGLVAGKRTLPWADFATVDVQRNAGFVGVVIRQKGSQKEWFTAARDTFPNLALFFALVNYLAAQAN